MLIKQIHKNHQEYLNQKLKLTGWVRSFRLSKNLAFIDLNDGSSLKGLQIILSPEMVQNMEGLGTGAAVTISGILTESKGKGQSYEMKAGNILLEGASTPDYPVQKKGHTPEFLRTISHLRPRTNKFMAVFRIRSLASFAIHEFFAKNDFVHVHSPIISPFDAEGAGEMFNVSTKLTADPKEDFFGKKAYLTVSGQLSAEAFALAFGKVYTFGPTFRAENSNTSRHCAEFWMIEPEIVGELKDIIELGENMVKYIINYVLEHGKEEMEFLNEKIDNTLTERLKKIATQDFGVISYTEAIEMLEKAAETGKNFEYPVEWGKDLQTEHERYLSEEIYQGPVFVTDYPAKIKAFYMRLNDDQKTVAATDLLMPGVGELIGGSQREERLEMLEKRMDDMGFEKDEYWWYLDLRRYGTIKHSGFGLGFERLVMYLTAIDNIRDSIPFPRTVNYLEF